MSVMRAIKVKETYKEWFKTVIKFTLPSSSLKPLSTECVNDMYRGISAKNCSRDGRGQSETRVHLQSLSFFYNVKNKQRLFSLFVDYLRADDFIQQRPLPILVNNENETNDFPCITAEDKCSSLFKRYGCSWFYIHCLCS